MRQKAQSQLAGVRVTEEAKRSRDELADKLYGRSGEFKEGFDAGYSHRDAEIERLVLCLEKLTRRHQWTPGMGDCICDPHLEAHELIEAHKKGRSE